MAKITQERMNRMGIMMWEATLCFLYQFKSHFFSINSSTKNHSPHSTKFQLAPCQKPVSVQTIKRLRVRFASLHRLPPSGK